MKKFKVNDITEAALYVAAYGLLALLTRYLITGVDSMIYYIYPLPMAILSARKSFKVGLVATLASIAVSFIFGNPLFVLILMMPAIIAGLILGVCLRRTPKQILIYLLIFVIFVVSEFFTLWLYEKINGIGYWDSLKPFIKLVISDEETANQVLTILGTVVILINCAVKEVFNIMLFGLLVNRLHLVKDVKINFHIPLRYNILLGILAVGMFVTTWVSIYCYLSYRTMVWEILLMISFILLFIVDIYILYQVTMFFRIKCPKVPNWCFIFIILGIFVLYPVSIVFGIILNIINFNYIKAAL